MESKSKFNISIIAKDIYKLYLKQELVKYRGRNSPLSVGYLVTVVRRHFKPKLGV